MPKCSITQSGNSYAVSTPYDVKKSPLFNAMLKRWILPEHRTPQKENGKFFWNIHPDAIQDVLQHIEDIFGERPELPELEPINAKQKYGFQLDYVGIPKERQGQAGKTALGLSNGQWRVVFSEDVLKGWFEQCQSERDQNETLFSLLLVKESATDQEIKSGYRRLARQWHPDVCKEENAAEMFRKIEEAHRVLIDPLKRKKYQAGLYLERSRNGQGDYRRDYYHDTFIPPLRCGNLTVTGSVSVGRLRVTEILSWTDCVNEQGQTMVSSWSKEREAVVIEWV